MITQEEKNIEIKEPHLFLVEGKDDEAFLSLAIKDFTGAQNVQIIEIGGKDNLKKKLQTYKPFAGLPLQIITVIFDADKSAKETFEEINRAITAAGLTAPNILGAFSDNSEGIKMRVYLFPDNQNSGSLETLMLQSEECLPPAADAEIGNFFTGVDGLKLSGYARKTHDKARFQALMSVKFGDGTAGVGGYLTKDKNFSVSLPESFHDLINFSY